MIPMPPSRHDEREAELTSLREEVARLKAENRRLKKRITSWETEAALKESEERFRAIFDSVQDAIFIKDRDHVYKMVNPHMAEMFGTTTDALIGLTDEDLFGEATARETRDVDRRVLEGEIVRDEQTKPVGGVPRTFHVIKVPMEDGTGRIVGICGVARDMTDRKRMETQLVAAKQEAEAASRAKSAFLANMSHEIRTPISGIIGMVEMSLTLETDAGQRHRLELIKGAADHLSDLIDDLLDFSKIEAGKVNFRPAIFDLYEILQRTGNGFQFHARKKGIGLELTIHPDVDRMIYADPQRLIQVLNNLVYNAIKFTEEGRIAVSVEREAETSPFGRLLFSVSDTGIGIPEDRIPELFQSFFQLDGSYAKKRGGAGLGLAISKKLVDMMGGVIVVDSAPGEGSTFYFTIRYGKVRPGTPPADVREGTEMRPSREPAARRPLSVLLAEDERLNRMHTVFGLENAGYQVTAVENGKEALAALEANDFDLVLMDIQMPEMDGVTTTRTIRASEGGRFDPTIPIVAMTAYAMGGDRERFLAAGVDACVSKPLEMDALVRVMEGVAGPGRVGRGA